MRTFTDAEGREWKIKVTVATLARIKERAEIDLMRIIEDDLIARLATDPVLLCRVLFLICEDQVDAHNITPEQFADGFAGDALAGAVDACLRAIVDFFPNPALRAGLGAILNKQAELQTAANGIILERVAKVIEAIVIDPTDGHSFGTAPASSASIQAGSPSASS